MSKKKMHKNDLEVLSEVIDTLVLQFQAIKHIGLWDRSLELQDFVKKLERIYKREAKK